MLNLRSKAFSFGPAVGVAPTSLASGERFRNVIVFPDFVGDTLPAEAQSPVIISVSILLNSP